eukprot:1421_1
MASETIDSINILNVDEYKSTISSTELTSHNTVDDSLFIVSDVDEELLILISFKHIFDLKSIQICSLLETHHVDEQWSGPKKIHVYKTKHINLNFEDIRSMKPNLTINCDPYKLTQGENIDLQNCSKNAVAFKSTKYLAIYIASNQKGTENTFINKIAFNAQINARQMQNTTYESAVGNLKTVNNNVNHRSQQKHDNGPLNLFLFDTKDTDNMSTLKTLTTQLESLNCDYSVTGLVTPDMNQNMVADNIETQSKFLSECTELKRLTFILKEYHSYIKEGKGTFYEELELLDTVQLLNDFNYLLKFHKDNFEDIYNYLIENIYNNKACKLSKCLSMKRNHRDKYLYSKHDDKLKSLYFNNSETQDILRQQLLDRIHCFYFHSFDTAYKFMNAETRQFMKNSEVSDTASIDSDNVLSMIRTNIDNKRKSCKRIAELNTRMKKFNCLERDVSDIRYSLGVRYFYWRYYKNNCNLQDDAHLWSQTYLGAPEANKDCLVRDWYIARKYSNLKEELICNAITCISTHQWDNLYAKSTVHLQTTKVKEMECWRSESSVCYDLYPNAPFAIGHLIAMQAYCNFDNLCVKFSETYRKVSGHETDDYLRKRHANFAHLGRLTRECVECFGTTISHGDTISLFHGINNHML